MSKLLIVESPTKARTIGRMLGNNYDIIASMGHVRDLPEHDFGIDIANNFTPQYVDTPRSRQVVKSLKDAAKKADEIFLATDPDREGEAIAWHLKNLLAPVNKKAPFYRVTFHEITRQAIENAISNRGDIDINLVDAQQARRILDRIVGYQVSPLLWRKLGKGSSAGRVQSAALRLIVEREREIQAFNPEEYWNFAAVFETANKELIRSKLFKINQKDVAVKSASQAEKIETAVKNGSIPTVVSVSLQERKRNPYPPFTTSTLQQAANQLLHYSATSTMRYAQQLYEGIDLGNGNSAGLITYMRTDSVTIAKEAQIAAADFIKSAYGKEYLPPKFNHYKNKAAAQEAHEAIRPTDVTRTPESLANILDGPQLKLYTLIWKRFVASQMAQARQELVTADVNIEGNDSSSYLFRSTATLTTFPGFLVLSGENKTEKEDCRPSLLRVLNSGDKLTLEEFIKEQKFTEPPPRFSEASLIKLLEENGIGRPSTYATIIRTIQDRSYVNKEQNKLLPTELGFAVNDFLVGSLPELFNIGFTASMEQLLDDVEAGSIHWVQMMTDFYSSFRPWLTAAKESGAPETDKASALLKIFDNVTFEEKQKIGRRVFDDSVFVESIRGKFSESSKMSDKQYQALLTLAVKYSSQVKEEIAQLSPEIQEDFAEAAKRYQERLDAEKQRPPVPEDGGYAPVFAAFDNVVFPEVKPGRYSFDEGKFFKSLKKQALAGKALSEKQLAALKKMALKYRSQLTDIPTVFTALQIDAPAEEENNNTEKIAEILEKLSKVTNWSVPEKKGRFAFDEKKFYQSISNQFKDGKSLSSKQISALEKLAAKYLSV